MKIRNGFVSNSSSSSFLFMTSLENHNRVMEQLNDYEKSIMKEVVYKRNFLSREVVYIGSLLVNDISYTFDDLPLKEGELYPIEIFDKYKKNIRETSESNEVFEWDIGD